MKNYYLLFPVLLMSLFCAAQPVPDLDFPTTVNLPRYPEGTGPVVGIDGGHNNLHKKGGGFQPFCNLLEADGYQTLEVLKINEEELNSIQVLVIANPLHASNLGNWQNPVPSAFTDSEISAIKKWVSAGGSLFVTADHMPFGGAAYALAQAFGFSYENGFTINKGQSSWPPETYSKAAGNLLENPVTEGIDSIAAFTGSALRCPEGAIPIARFPETHHLLLPEIAWQFDSTTIQKALDDYVLGAIMPFGKGKVAFFTEAAMFTAQLAQNRFKVGFNTPQAPQNQQFVLNLVHWLDPSKDRPASTSIKPALIDATFRSDKVEYSFTLTPDQELVFFVKRDSFYNNSPSTIYYSQKREGQWTVPGIAPFSGQYSDSSPFVSPAGDKLYFSSRRPQTGTKPLDQSDLWYVSIEDGKFGTPVCLTAVNSEKSEYSPSVDAQGNLYFGSYRDGGEGWGDIWIARFEQGEYQKPENLGPAINSKHGEWGSCIAPDGSFLIFEASGQAINLSGAGDLYISYFLDGKWQKPIHFDEPINSMGSDLTPKIHGDQFYFASNRHEDIKVMMNNNNVDIYQLPLEVLLKGVKGKSDE